MPLATNVATMQAASASWRRSSSQAVARPGLLSLVQLLLAGAFHLTAAYASPLPDGFSIAEGDEGARPGGDPSNPSMWIYLGTGLALVIIGGLFAGLTIALMGQDEVYLQVISTSGEGSEKKNAAKVLKLLQRGKHWVLVTLLVGNVITNETLPIVLDRSLGGGYAAAIVSTVLVIIFGEIVPQSICVRFGLPIGAWMAPMVLGLMWIFAPITWPIAKLLDYLLGEDHGTTYKKAGLKTLVTLHNTMETANGERLNEDEVTIISAVLDLKAKAVGSIMTPMEDVFTLSSEAVLDENLIDIIMREGYSRIPIFEPSNPQDFVGMLLVKMLITYDPEDCSKVKDFALATLPETRPDTSCLDIINFFQDGKSHMVLVSEFPGKPTGALGVVTLEDVIEELIGEEIIDESDVYIDVHKAIRRMQPAPMNRQLTRRIPKGEVVVDGSTQGVAEEHLLDADGNVKENGDVDATSEGGKRLSSASMDLPRSVNPKSHTFLMRRPSSVGSSNEIKQVQMHPSEMKQQLKKLGPSNAASRPRHTRINTVMVKPGMGRIPEQASPKRSSADVSRFAGSPPPVLKGKANLDQPIGSGHSAKDAVQAVQAIHTGFGAAEPTESPTGQQNLSPSTKSKGIQTSQPASRKPSSQRVPQAPNRSRSESTLGEMYTSDSDHSRRTAHSSKRPKGVPPVRSGSITENIVDSGGVKKLVLEPESSSESGGEGAEDSGTRRQSKSRSRPASTQRERGGVTWREQYNPHEGEEDQHGKKKKKKRKTRKLKAEPKDGTQDENRPLIR